MSSSCVRSGYCCKQSVCPYGEWDDRLSQCAFLEGKGVGDYRCGKYAEIIAIDPEQKHSPAFGHGCCSSLNPDRLLLIRSM
jgi:hypothetical protein